MWGGTGDKLRQADAARDARDWSRAGDLYETHLASRPDDWPIWIQLGHMRKETGQFAEAEVAYLKAEALSPEDADLALQLGHFMKLRGERQRAIKYYRRALKLNPQQGDAFRELSGLGDEKRANEILRKSAAAGINTWIDISDLIFYLRHHARVSGIQRVQVELLRNFISQDMGYGYVQIDVSGDISILSVGDVTGLIDLVDQAETDVSDLIQYTDQIRSNSRPFDPRSSGTYVLLGAFWVLPVIPRCMRDLKARGWHVVAYIYDLIPISAPEYCDDNLVRLFSEAFYSLIDLLDSVLTISEHTKREVEDQLRIIGVSIPVSAVALGHEMSVSAEGIDEEAWLVGKNLDAPYVLCVGTIEVRKNHTLLFNVWRSLHRERGDATPTLVLVGRPGWRVRDLMEQLAATGNISGKVRILHDLSDAELATLYRNCLFTVFPSFVEGWGLPVGESLGHGKLCLASNSSSVPEVGGDLVEYFDPLNALEAKSLVERYIDNASLREAAERKIASSFKPRPWSQVATKFSAELENRSSSSKGEAKHSWFGPSLEQGKEYQLGPQGIDYSAPDQAQSRRAVNVLTTDWHPVEPFGAWARNDRARVEFCTDCQPHTQIVIYLRLLAPPTIPSCNVEIKVNGKLAKKILPITGGQTVVVNGQTGGSSEISLQIKTLGDFALLPNESRMLFVGISSVTYIDSSDLLKRIEVLEQIVTNHIP
jgi:glycosyltransferase involved in cell wall biosynthesis